MKDNYHRRCGFEPAGTRTALPWKQKPMLQWKKHIVCGGILGSPVPRLSGGALAHHEITMKNLLDTNSGMIFKQLL